MALVMNGALSLGISVNIMFSQGKSMPLSRKSNIQTTIVS